MKTGLYVTLYNQCVKPILLYGSELWYIDFLINKPGVTQMEKRNDLFVPEKLSLNSLRMLWVSINIRLTVLSGQILVFFI